MKHSCRLSLFMTICALALSGCSGGWFGEEEDAPLPGTRVSVLQFEKALTADPAAASAPIDLGPVFDNQYWPQVGGYSVHSLQNVALPTGSLSALWDADIGNGSHASAPLITQPIAAFGFVFTLDTDGEVRAFDAKTGKQKWAIDTTKENDAGVYGGGIAAADDTLYITNGTRAVLAVNPKDGTLIWRKSLPAPSRTAPTVLDGRLYVMTLDHQLIALSIQDGADLWAYQGYQGGTAILGAAAVAAHHDMVVAPFSSGELVALRPTNGSVIWSDQLTPAARYGGPSRITDLKALPIIDKGTVTAVSYAGRTVMIDERTGSRIWQRDVGGLETPALSPSHLFMITGDQNLIAIDRMNGSIKWVKSLPAYKNIDERKGPLLWTGPLLAGGRLFVLSGTGTLIQINPSDGTIITQQETDIESASPFIVADKILYILDQDGTLNAFGRKE